MRKGDALTEAELSMTVEAFARANAGRWFSSNLLGDAFATIQAMDYAGHVMTMASTPGGPTMRHAILEPGDPGYIPAVGERFAMGGFPVGQCQDMYWRLDDGALIQCQGRADHAAPHRDITRRWWGGVDVGARCQVNRALAQCTHAAGHTDSHYSDVTGASWGTTITPAHQRGVYVPPAVVDGPGASILHPQYMAPERVMEGPVELIAAADAALQYLAGQVHPGETTAGRQMRERLVRNLMAALRKARGEGEAR
jgi:hypothetical protein